VYLHSAWSATSYWKKMKIKRLLFILITTVCCNASTLQQITEILQLPENKIDFAKACLVLSQDAFPQINIQDNLALFDRMASAINMISHNSAEPTQRIGSINTFLYRRGPWNRKPDGKNSIFEYDLKSVDNINPETFFIGYILSSNLGTCVTMPCLWYILADRLNWPVNAIRAPGHIFLRYSGIQHGNIEATVSGGYNSDSSYIRSFMISDKAIKYGTYMRPLSKKEFISTLLVNNAYYVYNVKNDNTLAEQYLTLAIKYDSTNAEAWNSLGVIKQIVFTSPSQIALVCQLKYPRIFIENKRKVLQGMLE